MLEFSDSDLSLLSKLCLADAEKLDQQRSAVILPKKMQQTVADKVKNRRDLAAKIGVEIDRRLAGELSQKA